MNLKRHGACMKTLETNDWIVLNNIIYQIHSIENLTEMREMLLEQLCILLDYESANFYISSAENKYNLVQPVFYQCDASVGEYYLKHYDTVDYGRGIMFSGKSMIYRETDIMPDEKRLQTEYYKACYLPNNWHHSLHMVISSNKRFLGVVSFFRKKGEPNFEYEDIFILEMLKDHLEYRLYQDILRKHQKDDKMTVKQCVAKYELTRREETILQSLVDGLDNDTICNSLCITNNTLKKHILNLYRKLGIKNRVQMFKLVKERNE